MPQISASTVVFLVAALMVVVGLAGLAPTILGAFTRGRRLTAELAAVEEERRRLTTFLSRDDADADGEPGYGTAALDGKDNAPAAVEDSASGQAQAPAQPRGEASLAGSRAPDRADEPPPDADALEDARDEAGDEPSEPEEEADGEDVDLTENGLLALFKETKAVHAAPEALLESVESISIADLLAEARVTRLLIAPAARAGRKDD